MFERGGDKFKLIGLGGLPARVCSVHNVGRTELDSRQCDAGTPSSPELHLSHNTSLQTRVIRIFERERHVRTFESS